MKKIFSLTFLIFSTTFCFSQISAPFKVRYQSYVNGDMTIIANNITNRVDSNGANVPYTSRTNMHKLNDEFMMDYIDIDNDPSTFSSSSAELILENPSTKKIIYAGLYWSATYLCKTSHMVKETEFIIDDPKRESFKEIKIKLPNQENYLDIKGEVIFDGLNVKKFKESAPYAVYADITNEVLKLKNPFGNYTVANIKATTGTISGGVAAGWTLFFIYEDTQMKGKFITSFDGFAGVSDRLVEIVFSGFKTLPEGNVEAKIAGSTLEGDYNLKGDQLLFKTTSKNKYIPLTSLLRDETNFFNSSITIGNDYFMSRKPDSKNTLGYDAFLITVPNPDNTVIGNNSKEATIRLKSSGDRCFLFFTAFNVAVTEQEKKVIPIEIKQELITSTDSIKKIENIPVLAAKIENKSNEIVSNSNITEKPQEILKQEVAAVKVKDSEVIIKPLVVKISDQKNQINNSNPVVVIEKSNNTTGIQSKSEVIQNKEVVPSPNNNSSLVVNTISEKNQIATINSETIKPIISETNNKEVITSNLPVIAENKNINTYNNTLESKPNTEIKPNEIIENKSISITENIKSDLNQDKTLSITENKIELVTENKSTPFTEINSQTITENKNTIIVTSKTEEVQTNIKENITKEIFNYNIEGVNKEYYIIANVFAKERNKRNFVKFLKSKGYNADYFYNPIKKYYYVYIDKGIEKEKIQTLHDTKINNSYKDDLWVLSVNMPKTNEAVVSKEVKSESVDNIITPNKVESVVPKENSIVASEKVSEINPVIQSNDIVVKEPETELIVTKTIVNNKSNKPSERIDAITDKNLEDKNTKVALIETDLNSLPSLQTSVTDKTAITTSPEKETSVAAIDNTIEKTETIKTIEDILPIISEPAMVQNNNNTDKLPKETPKVEINNDIKSDIAVKEATKNENKILADKIIPVSETNSIANKTTNENSVVPQISKPSSIANNTINTATNTSNNSAETTHQFKKEEIVNYNFAGLSKGYYIVANVFAKQRNSINFVNALKQKGINAASFYNPIKKYYYVYIEKSNDKAEIEGMYNTKINNTYKDSIWVLSINNPIKQDILVEI